MLVLDWQTIAAPRTANASADNSLLAGSSLSHTATRAPVHVETGTGTYYHYAADGAGAAAGVADGIDSGRVAMLMAECYHERAGPGTTPAHSTVA